MYISHFIEVKCDFRSTSTEKCKVPRAIRKSVQGAKYLYRKVQSASSNPQVSTRCHGHRVSTQTKAKGEPCAYSRKGHTWRTRRKEEWRPSVPKAIPSTTSHATAHLNQCKAPKPQSTSTSANAQVQNISKSYYTVDRGGADLRKCLLFSTRLERTVAKGCCPR